MQDQVGVCRVRLRGLGGASFLRGTRMTGQHGLLLRVCRFCLPGRLDLDRHLADEANAAPVDGLDQRLSLAIIPDGLPSGLDAARDGGIGNDAPLPDLLDDLVPGYDPIAVLDELKQQVKDLRFHGYVLATPAQLEAACVHPARSKL